MPSRALFSWSGMLFLLGNALLFILINNKESWVTKELRICRSPEVNYFMAFTGGKKSLSQRDGSIVCMASAIIWKIRASSLTKLI